MSRLRKRSGFGLLVVLLLVGALLLAACGGGDDDDSDASGDDEATTTTTEEPATTTTQPPAPAPLTGAPEVTPGASQRAAIVVKVDNVPNNLRPPQAGIDVADIVFEEPVEGTTRFAAFFHSNLPPRIGPVRSTRFLDPGIVWPLGGGLYVYSGGTPDKVAAIRESPLQTIDENGMQQAGARERDSSRRAPHNLYVHPDALLAWDGVKDHEPPPAYFTYLSDGQVFNGTPTSVVQINNDTKAEYAWDAVSGTWKRSARIDGSGAVKPHLAESGAQIAPTNIVVQRIGGVESRNELLGEGPAWVCTQGKCATATWRRGALEHVTEYFDANGVKLALTPGSTWVHLITGGEPTLTP